MVAAFSSGGCVTSQIEELSAAKWAVEIEHTGKNSPDYFSLDSILIDEDGVHMQVTGGPCIDYDRSCIRKVLIMKTNTPDD